jgi:hypothetical protein
MREASRECTGLMLTTTLGAVSVAWVCSERQKIAIRDRKRKGMDEFSRLATAYEKVMLYCNTVAEIHY